MKLDDDTEIYTNNNTQLVTTIYLDNCSNYTYKLFNFTLLNELTKSSINGDIEVFFQLINPLNYGEINNYNILLTNVSNGLVCSSSELYGQNVLYNAEIRYYTEGYATELYYIQQAIIEENGTDVKLYDLDSNHSTEFKITYQDSNYNFVEDAIVQLQRKYISDNTFETVEAPKTSDDGTLMLHIDLDSVVYRVTVVKNGEILNQFDNIVFSCVSLLTGECTQKLLGSVDSQNYVDYDTERDFSYSVSLDSDSISTSFSIPSSIPSTVRIELIQIDQFGNRTLSNESVTSSAGLIDMEYSTTIGDSYLTLNVYKNNEVVGTHTYIVREDPTLGWLNNNYIIMIVLMLSLVGMALTSPEWIIINSILTFVLSGMLMLANGLNFAVGLGLIMWLLIAAVILISKLAKQEDR